MGPLSWGSGDVWTAPESPRNKEKSCSWTKLSGHASGDSILVFHVALYHSLYTGPILYCPIKVSRDKRQNANAGISDSPVFSIPQLCLTAGFPIWLVGEANGD
jgi:hypothetical protein